MPFLRDAKNIAKILFLRNLLYKVKTRENLRVGVFFQWCWFNFLWLSCRLWWHYMWTMKKRSGKDVRICSTDSTVIHEGSIKIREKKMCTQTHKSIWLSTFLNQHKKHLDICHQKRCAKLRCAKKYLSFKEYWIIEIGKRIKTLF